MTDKVTLASISSFINDSTAATQYNANNVAITAAMDNTLSRDGTGPNQMAAPIDMNSNQIINLPNPVSLNSPVRLTDLNTSIAGGTIQAIPAGGNTGTVLIKNSNTNYDVSWSTQPGDNIAGLNMVVTGTNPVTVSTVNNPVFSTNVTTPALVNGGTLTLPTNTDTLVGRATTDTLTNKTIPSFVGGTAAGSSVVITSTSNVAPSGDFISLLADSIAIGGISGGGATTINLGSPGAQSATVGFTGATSGTTFVKASAVAAGTLTLPGSTDTLVGRATTDTLTNKTLSSPTFTGTPSGLGIIQINQCPAFRLTAAGVNFNAVGDTTFPIILPAGFSLYEIREVVISNPSAAMGTAQFGIFGASGGGTPTIFPATICSISTTAANTNNNMQLIAVTNFSSTSFNLANLFFRVTTAQGSAVTATVTFLIYPIA